MSGAILTIDEMRVDLDYTRKDIVNLAVICNNLRDFTTDQRGEPQRAQMFKVDLLKYEAILATAGRLETTIENKLQAAKKELGLPEIDVPFHPQTAADVLKRWDDGQGVFTIEMGGIGPSYEQCIQILVFEIIRDNLKTQFPDEKDKDASKEFWEKFGEESINRTNGKMGYSDAQVGVAKQVAYLALRDSWEGMLKSVPQDRLIQVSKHFPTL